MGISKRRFAVPGLLVLTLAISLGAGCVGNPNPDSFKPGGLGLGEKAYDFSLMDSTGRLVKQSDLQQGWYTIIFLYRGYWCSACLNQLLNLKDDYPKFTALHTAVVAASTDSIEDSAAFNQQWRFPFPLLSDTQLHLIDAYGARHPQGHDGKDIAHPSVIIISPNRVVCYKYVGKTPTDRPTDDEILFTLQQIQKPANKP
jgi:peroxiredoxin